MNVLVIGGGGREHTLAWKFNQSPQVERVFCAPGNPNMAGIESVALSDFGDLLDFAKAHDVGLTMVGPEAPLCDGIVDVFRGEGLPVFGPTREAAQLEGSKAYAKSFMARHGIPTAGYEQCASLGEARAAIERLGGQVVVKADGLAAGKGVTVAQTAAEAERAAAECFEGRFGQAGSSVVVEECLVGEEASILAFTDGQTILPLASSQDHKAIGDGDTGPNTGGMGAYSPAPVVTDARWAEINERVLGRFLAGVRADGLDYRGVIYAGIMVTDDGLKVLEFNVRFGDPETQAVLYRLDSDLLTAALACAEGRLHEADLQWSPEPACCVVMASGGYPAAYEKGHIIAGLEEAEATGATVFHAGTALRDGQVVTNGGRVLGVTAGGADLAAAIDAAYRAVHCIRWDGAYCRSDIGHRALARNACGASPQPS